MPREPRNSEPTFGFLSTLESAELGHFGGYLIVSTIGRPLEFHCTSPVRPNRAQIILYGPTLQPYLIGEQIAGTLLQAAKLTPKLVLTDSAAILSARAQSKAPFALLLSRDASNGATEADLLPFAEGDANQLTRFARHVLVGPYQLQLPTGYEADTNTVAEYAGQLSQQVDLAEPFDRIHEAIREAQRIGGSSVQEHGQAA